MKGESRFDAWVRSYGHWVIRWRWAVLLLAVTVAVVAASGVRFMRIEDDYRIFFSEDNPQLQAFDAIQDIYTKNDNILFVLAPQDGDVFTPDALAAVEELTHEAWQIPFAIRVDSITNFQHTEAEEDDLIVADLVENARALSPPGVDRARAIALGEPLLADRLVPPGTHVTGINVTLQLPGERPEEQAEAVAFARTLVDGVNRRHPQIDTYLTGFVMLNNAFQEAAMRDMQTLVPLMYLGIVVVMVLLLRSLTGTLAALGVIALSTASAMGLAGWLGLPLTPPSSAAPTMIMTLAVADSVHLLVSMLREMRAGHSKREALVESLRLNFMPVMLTSLTTAIGFLSMNFSDAPPFRDLGNMTAMGVTAAFVFSVLFLPAAMAILPVRVRRRAERSAQPMERLGDFVVRNRRALLWGSAAVVLAATALVPANDFNDQFVDYFDERIPFRTDTDFTMNNLTGIYQIEFSLGAGDPGGISSPEYLNKLDEFANWYRSQPEVVHVSSLSDVIKRLNVNLHGDDGSYYRLPDSRELAAQYLLLYEMSLPYGLDLNNQINVDKSATRFSVTLDNITSRELRDVAARGESWLRDNAPEWMFNTGVGPAVMFSHISKRNIQSMLGGTILALVLISLCLVFALRSFKFGALSLVPNLVPAVLAFGAWGATVGNVGIGLSVVTAMSLGIVVDDTVHFLAKYLRGRRERGLDAAGAVRYAFNSVGTALIVTSVILVAGFLVLAQSSFDFNAGMGKLTAVAIGAALLADFFLLPALLISLEPNPRPVRTKEVSRHDPTLATAQ